MGLFSFFKNDDFDDSSPTRRPRFRWLWWQWIKAIERHIYRVSDRSASVEGSLERIGLEVTEKIALLQEDVKALLHSREQALARIRVLEVASRLPHGPTALELEGRIKRISDTIIAVAGAADREINNLKARVQGEFPNDIAVAFSRIEGLQDTVQDLAEEVGDISARPVADLSIRLHVGALDKRIEALEAALKSKKIRRPRSVR